MQRPRLLDQLKSLWKDENFLEVLHGFEALVSKFLSIIMLVVILAVVMELIVVLGKDLLYPPYGRFGTNLFEIFGLFLNVLIALEILENITAYLKKHIIQVELVIGTSLIAVARKIIILDLEKKTASDLIALACAVIALSVSYWLVRQINIQRNSS